MNIHLFTHSLLSDWNHGNAHFLRGMVSELSARGHTVTAWEPANAWSIENLRAEPTGQAAMDALFGVYPALSDAVRVYDAETLDLSDALRDADLVIVHEWNPPDLVKRIGAHRTAGGNYVLLFHDTHHRAASEPQAMSAYDLSAYHGVLAFGEVLRRKYEANGWTRRAWTWHEAADPRVFHPLPDVAKERDFVWVGNWGDNEREKELHTFLLEPVRALGLRARVHGVRYPDAAKAALAESGIEYAGWLPNFRAPLAFAQARVTAHIPRRPYVETLTGIPTIRVFEALACGIPLVCSPWHDAENLFTPGTDYLTAQTGADMRDHLHRVVSDPVFAEDLAAQGLATVLARHTCAHRADELMAICEEVRDAV